MEMHIFGSKCFKRSMVSKNQEVGRQRWSSGRRWGMKDSEESAGFYGSATG